MIIICSQLHRSQAGSFKWVFFRSESCWNVSCLLYSSHTKVVAFPPTPPICNGAIRGKAYRFLATVAVVPCTICDDSPSIVFHICIHHEAILVCYPTSPWNDSYCFIEDESGFYPLKNRNFNIYFLYSRNIDPPWDPFPSVIYSLFQCVKLIILKSCSMLGVHIRSLTDTSSDKDYVVVLETSSHIAIAGIDICEHDLNQIRHTG